MQAEAETLAEITVAALMSPQDPTCQEIVLTVADWLETCARGLRNQGSTGDPGAAKGAPDRDV